MPVFYPTHPEPGDPPGFYGEVYFDGHQVTDRRKPGADPAHYQMTEWYVPVEPEEPATSPTASTTPDPSSELGAPRDRLERPVPVPFFVPLTRPRPAAQTSAPLTPAPQISAPLTPAAQPPGPELALVQAAPVVDSAPSLTDSYATTSTADTHATTLTADEINRRFDAAIAANRDIPTDILSYDNLDNKTIQELHRKNAELTRLVGVRMAITADQIAQRSAADLAGAGMARQSGDRTAIEMIKNLGGLTQPEAMAAVHTGRMMREDQSAPSDTDTDTADTNTPNAAPVRLPAPPPGPSEPWLMGVAKAVGEERLSSAQADKIRTGLGFPTESITAGMLAAAADYLVEHGHTLTPERLWKLARQTRDRLDRSGVALRQEERRAMRSARLIQRADGMFQLIWIMDPEQGMQLKTLVDRSTSPKLGGPRVGGTQAATAARIEQDLRAPAQKLSDDLMHLLEAGAVVDPGNILANPTASVSVLTIRRTPAPHAPSDATADTTAPGTAMTSTPHPAGTPNPHDHNVDHFPTGQYDLGWIEGHPDPVSPETVDRLICSGSTRNIDYDRDGRPLDVSREQRLFGRKQRVGLAATFGGCTWTDKFGNPVCDRPPSWTEAHHIEHWYRDKGKTVMDNGILLCKAHHLELHNDHWEILRKGLTYWLIPPRAVDPSQTPRLMKSHSEAYRELMSQHPPA